MKTSSSSSSSSSSSIRLCNRCQRGTVEPREHVIINATTRTTILILCAICDGEFHQEFVDKSTRVEWERLV